ncbi:MAG: hypothetical protein LBM98_04975 [Oscillospiraceae bacterium]|nr:hypothetical protein [Oscillospiraceae bacterium]
MRGTYYVLRPTSRRRAPSLRSTGKLAIRTRLQVRSNPVPGGQHTSYVSQDYYVNPGLLRRISLTTYRKCGGGFAKTVRRYGAPRAGLRPALSRRTAPGRNPVQTQRL